MGIEKPEAGPAAVSGQPATSLRSKQTRGGGQSQGRSREMNLIELILKSECFGTFQLWEQKNFPLFFKPVGVTLMCLMMLFCKNAIVTGNINMLTTAMAWAFFFFFLH